ncbi:hypothetical protein [Alicyclobacillus dauci]|uniref:Spore coat protein n=1 Tax=Alicyclobacillus dauci TaxID=1475485 RepID=A0ABY6YYY0_9BACL|nr:hypothetical protein [Alicyclobacillus dauci]WAH35664.1 hypothetical protein NZD86_15455 [Alicyclobacillus dauci]
MDNRDFATHEMVEMHEMLAFKNVCLTKSTTMQKLVSDEKLNDLLQTCAQFDRQHIEGLEGLLSKQTSTNTQ